jgi:hypothetical protein
VSELPLAHKTDALRSHQPSREIHGHSCVVTDRPGSLRRGHPVRHTTRTHAIPREASSSSSGRHRPEPTPPRRLPYHHIFLPTSRRRGSVRGEEPRRNRNAFRIGSEGEGERISGWISSCGRRGRSWSASSGSGCSAPRPRPSASAGPRPRPRAARRRSRRPTASDASTPRASRKR